jgi:hypothetical protein
MVSGDPTRELAESPHRRSPRAVIEIDGPPRRRAINQPLGLTVYCWRIRLDQFA